MADQNSEPSWRAAAGGPRRPGKQHSWKPDDEPTTGKGGRRVVMLFGIAAACLATVGGVVLLILLLMPKPKPALVTLAARPTEADRLDVPYDPAGFASARRLAAWAKGTAAATTGGELRLLAEEPAAVEADDWLDKAGDKDYDPVVVYAALAGGVLPNGDPVLYTGHDKPRHVTVEAVIDRMKDALKGKRKLLILDCGRGVPDRRRGELYQDFTRAVKEKLGPKIKETENLIVVCGAGDGQRGWDSPDLGMTPLAKALTDALAGKAAESDKSRFYAAELLGYVAREVEQWAKNNRPTDQTPLVLPADDPDRQSAAYRRRPFLVPTSAPPLPEATPTGVTAAMKAEWKRAADLAANRPHPAVYTPVAWRRYRELLLRYEQAELAGDALGGGKIRGELDACFAQIEAGRRLPASPALNATFTLLPAAGEPAPPIAGQVANASTLRAGEAVRRATEPQNRPAEAHLLAMLDLFNTAVAKGDKLDDGTGLLAVRTRVAAERAAVGARDDGQWWYAEQVWPLVRAELFAADAARRAAEDAVFASDGPANARKQLDSAAAKYKELLDRVGGYQAALGARDEAFADLPFLGRWVADCDGIKGRQVKDVFAEVLDLWKKAHDLAAKLDESAGENPAPPTAAARDDFKGRADALRDGLKRLKDVLAAEVADLPRGGADQPLYQRLQPLLAVPPPLLTAEDRETILTASRRVEQALSPIVNPLKGPERGPEGEKPAVKVRRRAELARAELNDKALADEAKKSAAADHSNLSAYVNEVLTGDEKTVPPLDSTSKAGGAIAANVQLLSGQNSSLPDTPADWAKAERLARLTVALAKDGTAEPGVPARKARWRGLLEGQAARLALDHWYNETGQKAFAKPVADLLAFAGELSEKGGVPESVSLARAAAAVKPLTLDLTAAGGSAGPARWTTESWQAFVVRLGGATAPVKGAAVAWAASSDPDWLTTNAGARTPVSVPAAAGADGSVRVEPGPKLTPTSDAAPKPVKITADVFFRGQRPRGEVAIPINPRPDLVVTDAPREPGGMLAVRAAKGLEPGRITIVIDFSYSMREQLNGKSKMSIALDTLRSVADALPPKTRVVVRGFSHSEKDDAWKGDGLKDWLKSPKFTEVLFPRAGVTAADFGIQKDDLFLRLGRLYPSFLTPLVDAIEEARREDFPGDDLPHTILVLTDGANTVLDGVQIVDDDIYKEGPIKRVQTKVAEIKSRLRENQSVHMVFFGADKEYKPAKEMFDGFESKPTPKHTAGRLYRSNNAKELLEQLAFILRPRVKLRDRNDNALPGDLVDSFGLTVNAQDEGRGRLWWWGRNAHLPTADGGQYKLKFGRHEADLTFLRGDRLTVRLSPTPAGGVRFDREVFYRDVEPLPGRTAETGNWHLAAPEYLVSRADRNHLMLAAALEDKADALRDPPRAEDADPGRLLQQRRPAFLWWDLTRFDGDKPRLSDGTVFVRNVRTQQFPAPTWQVAADDGTDPKWFKVRNRLRAVVVRNGEPPPLTAAVLTPATLGSAPAPAKTADPDVSVLVSVEEAAFLPGPVPLNAYHAVDPPGLCLVVRVTDRKNRLLVARPRGLSPDVPTEHRYFYDRDQPDKLDPERPKVVGYTALFRIGARDALTPVGEITLVSVSDLLAADVPPAERITLDLRDPPAGTLSDRQVIEPGKKELQLVLPDAR